MKSEEGVSTAQYNTTHTHNTGTRLAVSSGAKSTVAMTDDMEHPLSTDAESLGLSDCSCPSAVSKRLPLEEVPCLFVPFPFPRRRLPCRRDEPCRRMVLPLRVLPKDSLALLAGVDTGGVPLADARDSSPPPTPSAVLSASRRECSAVAPVASFRGVAVVSGLLPTSWRGVGSG